ncbi:hypothetical protein TorRG33x02_079760 [Trema orientale]|uniref:Uncharacterized protein n=1 Tax=Trema orientale TaxID=63057 RepID=A0A2P5FF16_TREOI|nr:hypothetical protein TorRG33x02_079760 [Trema orientale]
MSNESPTCSLFSLNLRLRCLPWLRMYLQTLESYYLSRTLPHLSSKLACPVSVFTVRLRIPVGENYTSLI